MIKILQKLIPLFILNYIDHLVSTYNWKKNNFLGNPPQFVKKKIFENYGIKDAIWIETATYIGTSTEFLRKKFPHVYSIEPSLNLYNKAIERIKEKNLTLYNKVSEKVFPKILSKLDRNIKI